jgi:biotin transport system permease protein
VESVVHRRDPRVKIASVIGLSIITLGGDIFSLTMITTCLIALVPMSRLKTHQIWLALRPVTFFLGLLFLLHLIFTKGTPVPPFPDWPVTVTYEGLYTGALITWRFALLVMSAAILTMTTSPSELIMGIERLLRPFQRFGIPSHDVAVMISLALRFVPTLLDEIDRLKEAQTARGAHFNNRNLVKRTRAFISLVIPLVMSTMRRADDLALAMEGRGYRRGPRTYLKELSMSRADYLALVLVTLLTGIHVLGRLVSAG